MMLGTDSYKGKRGKFPYLDSPTLWYILRRQMSLLVLLVVVAFGLEAVALVTDGLLELNFL